MIWIQRREFITLLSGAAAWPVAARAQQPARRPRLGVLIYSTPTGDPNTKSFLQAMRELGWVDRQTIDIEFRFAEGSAERLPQLAADLVRLMPDAIYALG